MNQIYLGFVFFALSFISQVAIAKSSSGLKPEDVFNKSEVVAVGVIEFEEKNWVFNFKCVLKGNKRQSLKMLLSSPYPATTFDVVQFATSMHGKELLLVANENGKGEVSLNFAEASVCPNPKADLWKKHKSLNSCLKSAEKVLARPGICSKRKT